VTAKSNVLGDSFSQVIHNRKVRTSSDSVPGPFSQKTRGTVGDHVPTFPAEGKDALAQKPQNRHRFSARDGSSDRRRAELQVLESRTRTVSFLSSGGPFQIEVFFRSSYILWQWSRRHEPARIVSRDGGEEEENA